MGAIEAATAATVVVWAVVVGTGVEQAVAEEKEEMAMVARGWQR